MLVSGFVFKHILRPTTRVVLYLLDDYLLTYIALFPRFHNAITTMCATTNAAVLGSRA